jgi:hypothetical protein
MPGDRQVSLVFYQDLRANSKCAVPPQGARQAGASAVAPASFDGIAPGHYIGGTAP